MSKLLKISYGLTLLLLVISVLFHNFQNKWLISILVFSLPFLWSLWLCCVVLEAKKSTRLLVALWVFIDVTVFAVLSLSANYADSHIGPRGDEYVFVIAYLPIFLPVLIVSFIPAIGTVFSAIGKGAAFVLLTEEMTKSLLFDWVSFSVISVIPSLGFLWLFYVWRKVDKE